MQIKRIFQKSLFFIALSASGVVLTGCGANHNSIFRGFTLVGKPLKDQPVASGHFVDAKQRALISSQRREGDDYFYTFCAEPNPDVFSVLSSSFAASGRFGQTGTDREAAAQLAKSLSENGLPTQAIRDQRTIVSILAIEQLTGTHFAPTVALSATATADTGKTALEIQSDLEKQRKAARESEEKKDKQEKELEELGGAKKKKEKERDGKKAELKTEQDKDKPSEEEVNELEEEIKSLDSDIAKGDEKIAAKKKELDATKASLKTQTDVVAGLEKKLEAALAVSTSGATDVTFSDCESCNPEALSEESVEKIAETVAEIVDRTFQLDEVQIGCLDHIRNPPVPGAETLTDATANLAFKDEKQSYHDASEFCFRYLETWANRENAKIAQELAKNKDAKELFNLMKQSRPQ